MILHIATCLEKSGNKELPCLIYNLNRISDTKIIVSINGTLPDEYSDTINNLKITKNIEILQRENIGYQWGAFYEVYKMYPDEDYYATLEVDFYLADQWKIICLDELKNIKIGYVGQSPYRAYAYANFPHGFLSQFTNTTPGHTRGSFYFCRKELLRDMDYKYNNFTNSKGCDHMLDGVVHGEIGFAMRTTELNYSMSAKEISFPIDVSNVRIRKAYKDFAYIDKNGAAIDVIDDEEFEKMNAKQKQKLKLYY